MSAAAMIGYLRIVAAGIASTIWRCLHGRPCPCELCRAHRAFVRESVTAYRAEVRSLRGTVNTAGQGCDRPGPS